MPVLISNIVRQCKFSHESQNKKVKAKNKIKNKKKKNKKSVKKKKKIIEKQNITKGMKNYWQRKGFLFLKKQKNKNENEKTKNKTRKKRKEISSNEKNNEKQVQNIHFQKKKNNYYFLFFCFFVAFVLLYLVSVKTIITYYNSFFAYSILKLHYNVPQSRSLYYLSHMLIVFSIFLLLIVVFNCNF